MKSRFGIVLILLAFTTVAQAQHSFLVWCSFNSGAATMGTPGARALGVVGQSAIGETRGGGFWVRGGFLTDTLVINTIVGVDEAPAGPVDYALEQNYPNPFNPSTTIRYALRKTQHVRLTIYNVLGDEIAVLVDAEEPPGVHTVVWNAGGVASGVYFCRLRAEEFAADRKLLLLR